MWKQSVAAGVLLLGAGAALSPMPVRAADHTRTAFDTWATINENPVQRAFIGGVVALRSPRSLMILVPRSSFLMGSTPLDVIEAALECSREDFGECRETQFANEMAQHRVTLSAFWLDRTEVTVADYQRCAELGRCRPIAFDHGARRYDHPEYPASLVAWEDARDFCRFRGARLPTEAEFERAARGRAGRRFPWGNLYNSRASNHGRHGLSATDASDGFEELARVGSFPSGKTPEGFLDLAGNVSEWVEDVYVPGYQDGNVVDPVTSAGTAGNFRVLRGGDYTSAAPWLRGAARLAAEPSKRAPHIGFRCARSRAKSPEQNAHSHDLHD